MEARARRQGRARGEVSSNLLEIIPSLSRKGKELQGDAWGKTISVSRLGPAPEFFGGCHGSLLPGRSLSLARPRRAGHSARALKRAFCLLLCAGLGLAVSSCESVDERHAGGGAFDDSYLGKRLDSNNPNLEDNQDEKGKTRVKSYSQWRHE
jgi:hypothetical protein